MSEIEVKAGTCWRDDSPGYWRWDGTRIMVCDDPRPTEDVSVYDLKQMLAMEANGSVRRVPTPDPLPPVLAAARALVTDPLNTPIQLEHPCMYVRQELVDNLRTALTAYEQQRQ